MGAKHKRVVAYDIPPEELLVQARKALQIAGFTVDSDFSDGNSIVASSGINFLSWGEELTVKVNSQSELLVVSRCKLPTQFIDWGKNRKNVNRFLDALDRRVKKQPMT